MKNHNIALRTKWYYETDSFKEEYARILHENFGNEEHHIKETIQTIVKLEWNIRPNKEETQQMYDYIYENFEDFIQDFRNYYVGQNSLASVSFGEQQEQLTGIRNYRTGKTYNLPYLRRIFDEEGFTVIGNYAYYDMTSEGLHIRFDESIPALQKLLKDL